MNLFSASYTPLQALITLSWVVFFLFTIDALQRKRFNALHFLVFFGWISVIVLFSFNINLLNKLWSFFWLNRWADLLVYVSIILLAYFYFEILNKVTRQSFLTTRIITEQAITNSFINFDHKDYKLIKHKLSDYLFLVRAYNEWTTIWLVIDEIITKWFTKVIVVNDWSVDNTAQVVSEKKKQYKDSLVILVSHLINRWAWSANKTGFEYIKKYSDNLDIKWVVTYDADWQMDIEDIDNYIRIIKNDSVDVLLWTRFIEWWKADNIPKLRRIVLFGSKIITYIFNWLWVTDPHNWYRILSVDTIKKLNIISDWMIYASELLEEIHRLWLKYREVPVHIRYTEYSLNKWQKNWNAFKIVLWLIYNKFFYK